MTPLAAWQTFYEIVGSSAGALIGLQFVVMSLISNLRTTRLDPQAGGTFATPNIIHFGTVLLLAGNLSAPWNGVGAPTVICGLVGLIGVIYVVRILHRLRRQTAYKPEFEDWLCHVLLPLAAYLTLAVSANAARGDVHDALFGIGAAALMLLFIGIHNAWDAVTYHVFVRTQENQRSISTPSVSTPSTEG